MKFILSYPAWFLLFCVITGAIYAGILYFRDRKLDIGQVLRYILPGLRFLSVAILVFLLLEPLIRTEKRTVEKPVIVIAQDNSESLLLSKDSSFYRNEFARSLQELKDQLSADYEVQTYSIGGEIREGLNFGFGDKQTNLSQLFSELYTRFYNRNLGAVILASDGIYNQGNSPVSVARKLKGVPVYTIMMGDTTIRKDQLIQDLAYNRLAYLGNEFPVELIAEAKKMNGQIMNIELQHNGNTLQSQQIQINTGQFSHTFKFRLEAKQTGLQHYRILIKPAEEELTLLNNAQDFYVEVLNSKQKILLLANSPHPDLGAIRNALEANSNYAVDEKMIQDFNTVPDNYSLAILHQLPSATNPAKDLILQLQNKGIPVLYILGNQSNINEFNRLNTGIQLKVSRSGSSNNNITAALNKGFTYFTMPDNTARKFAHFPPLQVPFGEWHFSPAVSVLFNQQLGTINTNYPLIAFNKEGRQKTGVIAGEGIWRWRLADFADNGSGELFDELIQKSVQFLSSKENKSFFRVFAKSDYREDEKIIIDAELYNESYELINDPDIEIIITNKDKKEFRFMFSRNGNSYRLNAGRLPAGEYDYSASVVVNNKTHTASGKFTVSPVQIEMMNAIANYQVLQNLAAETGGKALLPAQLGELNDLIHNKEEIVEVAYTSKKLDTILNFWWIFFLIVLLLGSEWFIRKWSGSY